MMSIDDLHKLLFSKIYSIQSLSIGLQMCSLWLRRIVFSSHLFLSSHQNYTVLKQKWEHFRFWTNSPKFSGWNSKCSQSCFNTVRKFKAPRLFNFIRPLKLLLGTRKHWLSENLIEHGRLTKNGHTKYN